MDDKALKIAVLNHLMKRMQDNEMHKKFPGGKKPVLVEHTEEMNIKPLHQMGEDADEGMASMHGSHLGDEMGDEEDHMEMPPGDMSDHDDEDEHDEDEHDDHSMM